jgi:hypothetical protein
MGIAVTVTLPVLVAVLATIGGILVVGVGGGLIRPMQARWENYLSSAEREGRELRARRFPHYAAPAGGVGSAGMGSPATVYHPAPSTPATPATPATPTTEQPQHWETGSTPEGVHPAPKPGVRRGCSVSGPTP